VGSTAGVKPAASPSISMSAPRSAALITSVPVTRSRLTPLCTVCFGCTVTSWRWVW
jgi:hypothetical protein